jgi:hypothetical protein
VQYRRGHRVLAGTCHRLGYLVLSHPQLIPTYFPFYESISGTPVVIRVYCNANSCEETETHRTDIKAPTNSGVILSVRRRPQISATPRLAQIYLQYILRGVQIYSARKKSRHSSCFFRSFSLLHQFTASQNFKNLA